MSYKSPIRLLYYFNKKAPETDLLKLRKMLFAELLLLGKTSLHINSFEYSKDEIINAIDYLKDEAVLVIESRIYKNKVLLRFLEKPTELIWVNRISNFFNGLNTLKARQICGQLLAEALTGYYKKMLSAHQFKKCSRAFGLTLYLSTENYMVLSETINTGLLKLNEDLENDVRLLKNNRLLSAQTWQTYKLIYRNKLATFLNLLPGDFDETRIKLAYRFANLVYYGREINTPGLNIAVRLVKEASQIRTSDKYINNYLNNFHLQLGRELKRKARKIEALIIIGIIVCLIVWSLCIGFWKLTELFGGLLFFLCFIYFINRQTEKAGLKKWFN